MSVHAYTTTGNALASTLKRMTEPTLADVDAWGRKEGRYKNFLWALEAIHGISDTMPVWEAKVALNRRLVREEGKRDHGHWSFDANRLIATRQMLEHIEAWEQR